MFKKMVTALAFLLGLLMVTPAQDKIATPSPTADFRPDGIWLMKSATSDLPKGTIWTIKTEGYAVTVSHQYPKNSSITGGDFTFFSDGRGETTTYQGKSTFSKTKWKDNKLVSKYRLRLPLRPDSKYSELVMDITNTLYLSKDGTKLSFESKTESNTTTLPRVNEKPVRLEFVRKQ